MKDIYLFLKKNQDIFKFDILMLNVINDIDNYDGSELILEPEYVEFEDMVYLKGKY